MIAAIPSQRGFVAPGIALSVLFAVVMWGGGDRLAKQIAEHRQARVAEQQRVATLDSIDDEVLLAADGPMGVRLRYRVTYPKGLDLDEGHGVFASLYSNEGRSDWLIDEWTKLRRTVTPPVPGDFAPGSYDIVEEFVPGFWPWSLIDPKLGPVEAYHCFRWGSPRDKQLAPEPRALKYVIYLDSVPLTKVTGNTYRNTDFYEGAIRRGAVECPPTAPR